MNARIRTLPAVICASLFLPSIVWAQNVAPDFTVVAYKVDSTQNPKNLFDGVADAIQHPVVGPLLVAGAIYLGLPPESIAGAAAIAAKSAREASADNARNPLRTGEERSYSFPVPKGYFVCAVNFRLNSIVPASGDRASFVAAGGNQAEVSVYTWTPKRGVGQGRSWVDMDVGILAIKAEKISKFRHKCSDPGRSHSFFSCRGQVCPVANGDWLKDAWAKGVDIADSDAAVDVVLRLLLHNR